MGKYHIKLFKPVVMSVSIIPVEDHQEYTVNGKTVYKNRDGAWECKVTLTTVETKAFLNYNKAIINNKDIKKHTKSEYKGS